MRIIVPNYPDADNFAENVVFTLRAMGHEVLTPVSKSISSPTSPGSFWMREISRRAFPARWTVQERWLVKSAQAACTDMVLCLTQAVNDEVLTELRRAGVRHMQAGLPQIGDMLPGVPELLEGNGIGRCIRDYAEPDIAGLVSYYLFHKQEREEAGRRAEQLHRDRYNYQAVFASTIDWIRESKTG